MTPEELIRARLLAAGTSAQERIYPLRMPPTETQIFPLIVYQRISAPRQYVQNGDAQLTEPRVQLSIWDDTYDGMMVLSLQVIEALSGWKDATIGVGHCFLMFELNQWEEQSGLYKNMVDAQIGLEGMLV